ncbi:MAG: sugar-binding protein [Anaerolineae bacterium]
MLPPPGQTSPGLAGRAPSQQAPAQQSRPRLIVLSLALFGALALLLVIGSRLNASSPPATSSPSPVAQMIVTDEPASATAPSSPEPGDTPESSAAPPAENTSPPASEPAQSPAPAEANPPASEPAQQPVPAANNPPARPTAVPANPSDTGPQLTAIRVDRPPTIDGNLGEWQGASQAVDAIVFGQENMSGVGDLGGRVWLEWDNDALYVAVLVIDDTLSQPSRGSNLYLGDSIEIQWDTNPPGDNSAVWDADDWHIGLSPGNFQDRPPESYIWTPVTGNGADMGVRMAGRPFMNNGQYQGYTIETAIPWPLVNVQPQSGQTFRLAVAISDDDIPQAVQQSMVATSPWRQWHRPDTLNTLVLK